MNALTEELKKLMNFKNRFPNNWIVELKTFFDWLRSIKISFEFARREFLNFNLNLNFMCTHCFT